MLDLNKYKKQIELFIPLFNTKELNIAIKDELPNLSIHDRLLISLELNRLNLPTNKKIDLRGKVKSTCKEYRLIDGKLHWLDELGISIYQKELPKFNNKFTEGLWEKVTNLRDRTNQSNLNFINSSNNPNKLLHCSGIEFGYTLFRKEKRVDIYSMIDIFIDDKKSYPATAINISKSGLRIMINSKVDLKSVKKVMVKFTEFNQLYPELDINSNYTIIKQSKNKELQTVVQMTIDKENPYLNECINLALSNSKIFATIDNQDIQLKTQNKIYEQFFINHTLSLPVFLTTSNLSYALVSENNNNIWRYWHDERNLATINNLLKPNRLKDIIESKDNFTVLYCFTYEFKNKLYFYSATKKELNNPKIKQLFFQLGTSKNSWRVYKLFANIVTKDFLSSADSLTDEVVSKLDSLAYCCQLHDITAQTQIEDYNCLAPKNLSNNLLNKFCHPRNDFAKARKIPMELKSQRCEERFKYPLNVVLTDDNTNSIEGVTQDFSSKGLNIIISKPLNTKKDAQISIDFKGISNANPNLHLDKVLYKVVWISKDYTNIRLNMIEDTPPQQEFLKQLIEINIHKLSTNINNILSKDFFNALSQIWLHNLTNIPFFISKIGGQLSIDYIGLNYPYLDLVKYIKTDKKNHFNLQSILANYIQLLIYLPIQQPYEYSKHSNELFLNVEQSTNGWNIVDSKLGASFKNKNDKIDFIKKIIKTNKFIALNISCLPITDIKEQLFPITAKLNNADNSLLKKLNNEINNISGYGEIIDTTIAVLERLEIKL